MPIDQLQPGLYLQRGNEIKSISYNSAWLQGEDVSEGTTHSVESLAASVSWLHAAYSLRADKISGMPREIMNRAGNIVEEKDLPFAINLDDLLWRSEYALNLYAKSYWFQVKNTRRVLKVRWFDPTTIEPKVSQSNGLYEFERTLGTKKDSYDVKDDLSDVIWIWLPGMREVGPGVAASSVVQTASEVLKSIDKFADMFFDQGAMPLLLLSIPPGTRDAERDRLESRFVRFATGVSNAFKPVAVRSNVTATTISSPPSDLAMTDLSEGKRDEILAAARVPVSLVLGTAVNFATARQEAQNFIETVMQPRAKFVQAQLNRQLFTPHGLTLTFHPERLPIMQQDNKVAAETFETLVTGGMNPEAAAFIAGFDGKNLPKGLSMFALSDEDSSIDGAADSSKIARPTEQVYGYHIETGVLSRNEARASIGLPPEKEDPLERERVDLMTQFDIMRAAVSSGLSREYAAELAGFNAADVMQEPNPSPDNSAEKIADLTRWRRKAKKAIKNGNGGGVDFESEYIDDFEALAIRQLLADVESAEEVDAVFDGSPFRLDFEGYP